MKINEIFTLLDKWKNLPSYQLERRVDIFFAIHLEKILEYKKQVNIDLIIPEFPIRKGDLPHHPEFNKKPLLKPNQSFKIDYLCYASKPIPRIFFIELKTEMSSRNPKQDWYLEQASELGIKRILKGIHTIKENTKQSDKYENLIDMLKNIEQLQFDIKPGILYIQPSLKENDNQEEIIIFEEVIKALSNSEDTLTIRFIQSLKKWK